MAERGGKRPGAGRKPGNVEPEAVMRRRKVDRTLNKLTPELLTIMAELARGIWFDDVNLGKVYKTKPDRQAAQYLLDHAVGKPVERQELTGKNGTPLVPQVSLTEEEKAARVNAFIELAKQRASAFDDEGSTIPDSAVSASENAYQTNAEISDSGANFSETKEAPSKNTKRNIVDALEILENRNGSSDGN